MPKNGSGRNPGRPGTAAVLEEKVRRLEEQKLWYEGLVAAIGDGISVQGADFTILYQNRAHRELMGEHHGEACFRAYARRDSVCPDCCLQAPLRDGSVLTVERSRENGETLIHYEITVSPLRDARGIIVAGIEVVREITDRKKAEEQLRYLSSHDVLTGLYNRTYFDQEVARFKGGRRFPFSIIMADIDDLKVMNDSLGHRAGDELLCRTAVIFKQLLRAEDVVARIGGDEFAALVPDAGADVAEEALQRIRGVLTAWNDNYPTPINLSLGRGTATCSDDVVEALQEADRTMYEDKIRRTGRSPRHAFHTDQESVGLGDS